ncbi:hypothetical protein PUN28_001018 [Cardiocondyla obscurior]|uniref:Glutathione S-transferase n=1 Tax=Cardiocondyla obscurior TaxID=286306 RepID=A0AAW2H2V8_9HYME
MPIDCYYLPPSPPCRTIMLLAKALGIHFNFKLVNPMKGEHLTPEFVQMNPQHTIPTIDDDGFILWESRPIMAYLVGKYAKNDALYPKDPKQRAVVDQMMYFDAGSLYLGFLKCFFPICRGLANSLNEAEVARVEKSFQVLNALLDGREFATGDNLTIADFTLSTTICTMLMNPQHTIPTLDDNGVYLWESRAIMTYLANQYGKNDSLYPKEPKKRAVVDQRLYFDLGSLYQSFADYYYTLIFTGVTPDQAKFEKINNVLSFLDKFLEGENYAAGKTLTLADLALVVTISNFKLMDHDLSKYSNILKWYDRIQSEAPKFNEIESAGMKAFKDFVDNLRKNK